MALPVYPNDISLTQIQTNMGGSVAIALSEYYSGAGYTPSNLGSTAWTYGTFTRSFRGIVGPSAIQTTVPSSGSISFGNFHGGYFYFNDTISSNMSETYNLRTRAVAAGWNGSHILKATTTVNSGIYVYYRGPYSYNNASMYTGSTSYPAGSTWSITNNGVIIGAGGMGGAGGSAFNGLLYAATAGDGGGIGLQVAGSINLAVSVYNANIISGGSGGGGGGGSTFQSTPAGKGVDTNVAGGGAGGNGAYNTYAVGAGGVPLNNSKTYTYNGGDGGASSTGAAGGGGIGGLNGSPRSTYGAGGDGGNGGGTWATAGTAGTNYYTGSSSSAVSGTSGAAGGAAGNAVVGTANITWVAVGTRYGTIS